LAPSLIVRPLNRPHVLANGRQVLIVGGVPGSSRWMSWDLGDGSQVELEIEVVQS